MKRILGFVLVCALLAIPALAVNNSQSVKFPCAMQVGSTALPAGEYKVSYTGTGATAQVTIEKKGVPTLTVPVKVVEEKHDHIGISTNTQGDKEVLQMILLSHVSLIL